MHNYLAADSEMIELIKIATFNLFNFMEPPGAYYGFENIYSQEQWQKKLDWITTYLNEHQPDVIAFQEVFSPKALAKLTQACGLNYFAVLDEPDIVDDFIYSNPVLAIASRYPIKEIHSVEVDTQLADMIGMPSGFNFSRKPLRATIDLPKLGPCDCYVVHFKSKRPLFDAQTEYSPSQVEAQMKTGQLLAVEALAQWGSSIQRGSEAALLRFAMVARRASTQNPVLLMGDFNDSLEDGVLASLISLDTRIKPDPDVGDASSQLQEYQFQDAYELYQSSQNCASSQLRPATYYYLAQGSVLDYILLSCEFDAKNSRSLAEVEHYETYDRHLINPRFDLDSQSTDHAPVMITLSIRY